MSASLSLAALQALAAFWLAAECRTGKGREKIAFVKEAALRTASFARIAHIRRGAADLQKAEELETLVAFIEEAELAASEDNVQRGMAIVKQRA